MKDDDWYEITSDCEYEAIYAAQRRLFRAIRGPVEQFLSNEFADLGILDSR